MFDRGGLIKIRSTRITRGLIIVSLQSRFDTLQPVLVPDCSGRRMAAGTALCGHRRCTHDVAIPFMAELRGWFPTDYPGDSATFHALSRRHGQGAGGTAPPV